MSFRKCTYIIDITKKFDFAIVKFPRVFKISCGLNFAKMAKINRKN